MLGPGWLGWCWAATVSWQERSRHHHHHHSTNNITTTTTTMSEEHFDQWEHYNFEEKVVRSRNSGEEPVLVTLSPSLSLLAHKLKFRVGRESEQNGLGVITPHTTGQTQLVSTARNMMGTLISGQSRNSRKADRNGIAQ